MAAFSFVFFCFPYRSGVLISRCSVLAPSCLHSISFLGPSFASSCFPRRLSLCLVVWGLLQKEGSSLSPLCLRVLFSLDSRFCFCRSGDRMGTRVPQHNASATPCKQHTPTHISNRGGLWCTHALIGRRKPAFAACGSGRACAVSSIFAEQVDYFFCFVFSSFLVRS